MTNREGLFDLSCAEAQESLSAMLDGEADMAEETAVRHHVDACRQCRSFETDLLALQKNIAALPQRPGDGAAAWVRARTEIAALQAQQPMSSRQSNWTSLNRWAIAATVLLALTVGGWQMFTPGTIGSAIIVETARDFQIFRTSGEVLDISATHPDAVHNWMMARVDFMLPGKLRAPDGARIAGARLCSLLGRKLAFIAYSMEGKDVGLYIARAKGLGLPSGGAIKVLQEEDGLSAIGWRTGDLAYVIVSEMPIAALSEFSTYFQRLSRDSRSS